MNLTEFYGISGGSFGEVLARIPNEKLIAKYILKFPSDPAYRLLLNAFDAKIREEAFRAAHTLKGLASTLGFARLADAAAALTEELRSGKEDLASLSSELSAVMREYDRISAAIPLIEF